MAVANSFRLTAGTAGHIINHMPERSQRVAKENREERSERGFVVTKDDIDIVSFIHEFRLLRIEQLERLTGRSYTRVFRRVKGLLVGRFLNRYQRPQKPDVYYMAERGIALLLAHGRITDDEAERRRREHELKPMTLDHELQISDLHLALELATRSEPIQLVAWKQGGEVHDSFTVGGVFGVGAKKVNIQPDAFFQIVDTRRPEGSNTRSFFAEVDRSTMPIKARAGSQRFRDKIERYHLFIKEGRPKERFGVESIRILTLTLTPERRDNVCADTEKYINESNVSRLSKSFLFGSLTDVALEDPEWIFAPVFIRPNTNRHAYPLLPALADSA